MFSAVVPRTIYKKKNTIFSLLRQEFPVIGRGPGVEEVLPLSQNHSKPTKQSKVLKQDW